MINMCIKPKQTVNYLVTRAPARHMLKHLTLAFGKEDEFVCYILAYNVSYRNIYEIMAAQDQPWSDLIF